MNKKCPRCGRMSLRKNGTRHAVGKPLWQCREGSGERRVCYTTVYPDAPVVRGFTGKEQRAPQKFRQKLTTERFLITAAQNATPVHAGFMRALEIAAKHLKAQIIVIPLRYKNPTSRWTKSQENAESWAPEVTKYLCNERKKLNANLVLLADIKTQPTAVEPLSGFEAITHGESGILGHTKLQLKTIPTPQGKFPKILTTTGACTVQNYTDSKAGKLGEFHHTLGAALVEISGKKFHLRQINADKRTGEFTDLDRTYSDRGVAAAPPPLALVMGDTHVGSIDPAVEAATFGHAGIVPTLKPQHLIWHDLLDGYAVNPHHNGNVFQAYAKLTSAKNDIGAEVRAACRYVREHTPDGCQSVVVASNHDDFLRRWIINTDWRSDPRNAQFYLETAAGMLRTARTGKAGLEMQSPFVQWLHKLVPEAKTVGGTQSFQLAGIELSMHGDRGPNGAKGSIRNLRRIGVKSVIAHTHSPGINEGCYQAGTSTYLNLEYTSGPSGWLNTHVLLYANGKRTLITMIDGEWRL